LVQEFGAFDNNNSRQRSFHQGGGKETYRDGRGGKHSDVMFAQFSRGRGRGRGHGGSEQYSHTATNSSDELVVGKDGEIKQEIEYFGCHFYGHCSGECPYARRTGANLAHIRYILTHDGTPADIPTPWILLDTCSTVSVSNTHKLVTNIRQCKSDEVLTAITSGGSQIYTQIAELIMFPIDVHFKKDSMATILSFKDVFSIPGFRIMMDTYKEKAFLAHLNNDEIFKFRECSNGLYYYDKECIPRFSRF